MIINWWNFDGSYVENKQDFTEGEKNFFLRGGAQNVGRPFTPQLDPTRLLYLVVMADIGLKCSELIMDGLEQPFEAEWDSRKTE